MGRAMLSRNPDEPGYNLVTLRNDSVFVYDKELGSPGKQLVYKFNYLNPHLIDSLPVSPKPDFSVNQAYNKILPVFELSDTASVFAGPCLVNDTIVIYGNSLGWIKAINTRNKKELWKYKTVGPVYSTPVTNQGIVALY